jgi:foldase protein PrsA
LRQETDLLKKSRIIVIVALLAGGCGSDGERTDGPRDGQPLAKSQPASPPVVESSSTQPIEAMDEADPIIAHIDKINITRSQIVKPLLEGYGLNVLLNTATLEMARQEAAKLGMTVTPDDIAAEHDMTMAKMFVDAKKEDYPQLLEQFLTQSHVSRPEFDIILETNAYLRKIAQPAVEASINEEKLQEAFKILYGETVQVRHIQCSNPQEIAEAKRMLAAGEPFDQVARKVSRNQTTAPMGGELPPFSRNAAGYPQVFKDVAFSLKPGEVSDTVQAGDAYHLILLEKRIAPKAVKYDDVKDSLRKDLAERMTQVQVKNLRVQLLNQITATMKVDDPMLAKQYELKKTQSDTAVHGKQDALDAIKRDGRAAAEQAEQTSGQTGEGLRPPATMPGGGPGESNLPITTQPTTRP